MAEAYGKLTGNPGVCFVTRGPGACHASVGVHIAHQDSTPMVMFVGQVPRPFVGREAFQEVDVEQMFGWTTKWAAQIDDPARIPEFVSRAFHTARSGRPGPVVLAIPEDMQRETAVVADVEPAMLAPSYPGHMEMRRLHELLSKAERPLMILGGGGWTSQACDDLAAFAKANHIPTLVDFRRQDLLSNRHPSYAGDLAYAKDPKVAERLRQADFVLAVGTRLSDVTTEGYTLLQPPRPQATLIHVYPDANEIGRVYQPDVAIVASMTEFAAAVKTLEPLDWMAWGDWVKGARYDYLETLEAAESPGNIDLYKVMDTVRTRLPQDAIITLDAGNFSGWPQRFYQFTQFRTLLGPANGAMGYGVPAGIAAKLVAPDKPVVSFVGDGGFMMSGNELATAMHHGIAPVILVFNNSMYGTIRLHQEKRFPGRVSGTGLTNPDFAKFAESFGAFGAAIEKTEDFGPAFEEALTCGRAAVLDIRMDPEAITTRSTLSQARETALRAQHGGNLPAPARSTSRPAASPAADFDADQPTGAFAPPWQSAGSAVPTTSSPAVRPAVPTAPSQPAPPAPGAAPQRASGPPPPLSQAAITPPQAPMPTTQEQEPVVEQAVFPAQMPAEVQIDPEFAEAAVESPVPDFLDVQPTAVGTGDPAESTESQGDPEAAPAEAVPTTAPEAKPAASRPVFRRGRAKQEPAPAQPKLKLQASKARRQPQPRIKPVAETQRTMPARRIITRQATRRTVPPPSAPATPPATPATTPAPPERAPVAAARSTAPARRIPPRRVARPAIQRPQTPATPQPPAQAPAQPTPIASPERPKRQLPARQVQRKPVQRQATRKAPTRTPAPTIRAAGPSADAITPAAPAPQKPQSEDS